MIETLIVLGAGFLTGITTILFGFGGGFVVVPFVYHLISASGEQPGQACLLYTSPSPETRGSISYAVFCLKRGGGLLADGVIRGLFVAYMAVTIADCLFRRGFLIKPARAELSPATLWGGGPLIGGIATLLGVGGSVMTVPLLRRHGYDMKYCVSAANPLSIPVAVIGALMYIVLGWREMSGPQYLGYVNLNILGLLVAAGIAGIAFARRCLPKVSDALHAKIYVLLLIAVLIAICV